jgi:hypothetical protein
MIRRPRSRACKDGRTALAYKAERAVDMETGAIVAATTHVGAVGDITSVGETCRRREKRLPNRSQNQQRMTSSR